MKSIAFVVPYFGTLPDYFPIWLHSCGQNPTVDFYIFTDDKHSFDLPKNVFVIPMTFQEVCDLLQKEFEFPIALKKPYKLCDYRPLYGLAFSKWIGKYDYWGHCDIDLIWGDIRTFATDEKLEKCERFLSQGHCSLYRNNDIVNHYYRTLPDMGCQKWHEVYTTEENCSFDEYAEHRGGGLSLIMEKNNIPVNYEWCFAGPSSDKIFFHLGYDENTYCTTAKDEYGCFFVRDTKGLFFYYRVEGEIRAKEFMYVHFYKKRIRFCKANNKECIAIIPPAKVIPCRQTDDVNMACLYRKISFRSTILVFLYNSKILNVLTRVTNKFKRFLRVFYK